MLNEYLKATNGVERAIKAYVVANASEVLTAKILKGNKNMSDCLNYIKGEAKKQAVGGCACIPDEDVFGWAMHYFEEDDIKATKTSEPVKVVAPTVKPVKEEKPKKAEPKKAEPKKVEEVHQTTLFDFM